MKTKKFTIAIAMMLLTIGQVYSQERLTITNEKPGKLRKQLPNKSKNDLKELVVYGSINGKDLLEIYKLPNLKSLDLSNAVLQDLSEINEIASIDYWERRGVFYLPETISYDTLKLPKDNWMIVPSVSEIGKWGAERRIKHLWMYPGYDGKTLGKLNYTTVSNLTYHLHFYPYRIYDRQDFDMSKRDSNDVGFLELGIYTNRSDNHYCLAKALEKDNGSISGMLQPGRHCIYSYPLFSIVYVPNREVLGNLGLTTLNTTMVIIEDEKDSSIVFYPFNDTIFELKRKRTFAPYAVSTNDNIQEVVLNGNTPIIPRSCFYCCFNLKKVDLTGVKSIGAYAFSNTAINKVVIPASVKELDCSAFLYSKLDTIVFEGKTPPEITNWDRIYNKGKSEYYISTTNKPHWDDEYGKHWKGLTIIVPDDALQHYNTGFWNELGVVTKNQKTDYEITITEPGTIALQIDNNMLRTARSISIKGVIYDTDIEYLNKCKSLQSLDLSMCFVMKSPKTFQKELDEVQGMIYLYQVLGTAAVEQAEHEYAVGNMNLGDAASSTIVGEYMKLLSDMLSSQEIKANPSCIAPEIEIKTLRHYKMPLQAPIVSGFSHLPELLSVELPPDASTIARGAFAGCMKLHHVKIPNSVSHLENGAFDNCGLVEIDLSETAIRDYDGYYLGYGHYSMFDRRCSYSCDHDCPNLETVRLPKNAYKWNGSIEYGTELYIYSAKPPKDIDLKWNYKPKQPRTLHVPRGCKLNYSDINEKTTVVDDIEFVPTHEKEFVPDPTEENLSLYSSEGTRILVFNNGKIYLSEIIDGSIVGEIDNNKLVIGGKEAAIFKEVSMYTSEGKKIVSLDGSELSCLNYTAIVNGKKICDKNTEETIAVFNKTPNIKELLAAYFIIISVLKSN